LQKALNKDPGITNWMIYRYLRSRRVKKLPTHFYI